MIDYPMTITDRIDFDVTCLTDYFQRLFSMGEEASKIKPAADTDGEDSEQFVNHSIAAFIRPAMACSIYGLLDFWLAKLCSFHQCKSNLPLNHKDIKANSELRAYHKYLTKVALLDLRAVLPNLNHLDSLRKVRNCLIHGGAHVEEQNRQEIGNISGISVQGSLLVISDAFIWDSLDHVKTYLLAVARA